jgi:integrase
MASISRDKSGRVTIQFVHPQDKKRRSIRAGKMSERDGENLKRRIEDLAAALSSGLSLDAETQTWLARIGDALRDKLAAVGLCEPLKTALLGDFLDAYITTRTDAKPRTIINLRTCANRMTEQFGKECDLRKITKADAEEFRLHMMENYAPATVGRTIKRCRQFLAHAIDRELLTKNPFDKVKAAACENRSRIRFVDRQEAQAVLDACPDLQWRLLFALSRFGGLRCPSEMIGLEWGNVNWELDRFWVGSPKTEHHEGKEGRWVPIFPELRPYLEQAFDAAEEGATCILTIVDFEGAKLRRKFTRIIHKAGLKPWERIFHNLRASRETELAALFPLHLVCEWMGNQTAIAAKHYLKATDADFQRAAKSGAVALHFPVQHDTAPPRTDSQLSSEDLAGCGVVRGGAEECESLEGASIPPRGLEPLS